MSDFLQPTPYEPDQFDNQPVANGEDDAQRERERE